VTHTTPSTQAPLLRQPFSGYRGATGRA
jgi:hypothetical protein